MSIDLDAIFSPFLNKKKYVTSLDGKINTVTG